MNCLTTLDSDTAAACGVLDNVYIMRFDTNVFFNCVDVTDGKEYRIELEAQQLVINSGKFSTRGHCYLYSKREDGGWDVHNDERIYCRNQFDANKQAVLICYKIISCMDMALPDYDTSDEESESG